jgi:hypothetical protein
MGENAMTFRTTAIMGIALGAISCFLISKQVIAGTATTTAPIITYTANGTFASVPTSGADTLKLAAEPFTVSIAVSAATVPFKIGPNWAAYNRLKLTGTVHSGLLGPTPVNIASNQATIIQAIAPNQYDLFTMESPVSVIGIALTIKASVVMPYGTISNQLLHPFNAVTLVPGNASVIYSNGTDSTTLAVQSGTLTATIP